MAIIKQPKRLLEAFIFTFSFALSGIKLTAKLSTTIIASKVGSIEIFSTLYAVRLILTIILDIPMGFLADKMGYKKIFVSSIALSSISSIFILTNNLILILIAFFSSSIITVSRNGKIESSVFNYLKARNGLHHYGKVMSFYYVITDVLRAASVTYGSYVYMNYGKLYLGMIASVVNAALLAAAIFLIDPNEKMPPSSSKVSIANFLKECSLIKSSHSNIYYAILFCACSVFISTETIRFIEMLAAHNIPERPDVIALMYRYYLAALAIGSIMSMFLHHKISISKAFKVSFICSATVAFLVVGNQQFIINIGNVPVPLEIIPCLGSALIFCVLEVNIIRQFDNYMPAGFRRTMNSVLTLTSYIISALFYCSSSIISKNFQSFNFSSGTVYLVIAMLYLVSYRQVKQDLAEGQIKSNLGNSAS